jgi:hypothetical protein
MSYTLGQAAKAVGMSKRPSCEASRQAGSAQGGMSSIGQCSHAPHSAGEQKAPAVQRLIWLGNQNLWRIRHTCPESPNWIVVLGGEKSFWLICARALAAADSIVHED